MEIKVKDYYDICIAEGVSCDGGIDCKTRTNPTKNYCRNCYCSKCTRGKCQIINTGA